VSEPLFPPMPPVTRPEQAKPRPPVPREVNIAFAVWVLSAVLSLVLQLLDVSAFVEQYQKQLAGTAQEQLSTGTLKGIYIVAVVAVSVLMVFFAWKMRSGRKWARAVIAILAILGLMFQAMSVGVGDVLAIAGVLITATGLVFMFVPASNAYFNAFIRRP
jgi:hypothetical protein